jgi:hypothetical protein
MKRTWTILGVGDVPRSLKWYQALFGQPVTLPAHDYFGQILDSVNPESSDRSTTANVLVRDEPDDEEDEQEKGDDSEKDEDDDNEEGEDDDGYSE